MEDEEKNSSFNSSDDVHVLMKNTVKVAAEVVYQVPDLQPIKTGDIRHFFLSHLGNLSQTCLVLP